MYRRGFIGLAAVAVLCMAQFASGQGKFNKKVKIGDQAPSFDLLPGVDGKKHSLSDFSKKDVVVVCITCNHCPFATDYEDRLVGFAKKYVSIPESKVALVAINVNNTAEDRLDKMIERSRQKGFNFPYLYDSTQQVARLLGASVTPEFFVLNKNRKIVYMGAMDDSLEPKDVKSHYVADAVDALLRGQSPQVTETRPVGCGVEYEKKK